MRALPKSAEVDHSGLLVVILLVLMVAFFFTPRPKRRADVSETLSALDEQARYAAQMLQETDTLARHYGEDADGVHDARS